MVAFLLTIFKIKVSNEFCFFFETVFKDQNPLSKLKLSKNFKYYFTELPDTIRKIELYSDYIYLNDKQLRKIKIIKTLKRTSLCNKWIKINLF